ncbi:DUF6233 domain-containing protein [Actinacidiphila alni]|uniref:DUF6233 domain-containing protein n=1 Tax=Actinacidiphila alni TaxID=380248 RepID=UPI0033F2BB78
MRGSPQSSRGSVGPSGRRGRMPVLHRHGCPGSEQHSHRGAARDVLADLNFPATPCPRCRPDLALLED